MKIILDVFGGDHAPLEPLKGAQQAIKEYGVNILAVGDIPTMEKCIKDNNIDATNMEFLQADEVFLIEDDAEDVIKKKTNTSLHIALKALADGKGDALVSAGSTGALVMGATFIVKRVKGCKRPTIGTVVPCKNPKGFLLVDSGANTTVRSDMLNQFAVMGSIYMQHVAGIHTPKVGLLNSGSEENKGTEVHIEAHSLLKENKDLNFVGNIEGRDILEDVANVIVADGFSGNIALKSVEGVAAFVNSELKTMFKANLLTMLAAVLMKGQLRKFKKKLDYREYGGAPILGISKGVIKAHGSSNSLAFKNAIRQAKNYVTYDVSSLIEESLNKAKEG